MRPSPKYFISYYREAIFEARFWFLALGLIFLLGLAAGILVSLTIPSLSSTILKSYASSVSVEQKEGLGLSFFIFKKNLSIVVLGSFLGAIFGIVPAIITNLNGFLLGIVLGFGQLYSRINPWQLFWLLFPHGIFEYAGSFLALTFGFRSGLRWLKKVEGSRKTIFLTDLKNLLAIFPLVIFLLALAALIEGNLTSRLACLFAGLCR